MQSWGNLCRTDERDLIEKTKAREGPRGEIRFTTTRNTPSQIFFENRKKKKKTIFQSLPCNKTKQNTKKGGEKRGGSDFRAEFLPNISYETEGRIKEGRSAPLSRQKRTRARPIDERKVKNRTEFSGSSLEAER